MNSPKDKYKRLLKHYSTNSLKDYFDIKGSSEEMIEIISNKNEKTIQKFIVENHLVSRQHIYIYTMSTKYKNPGKMVGFPIPVIDDDQDAHKGHTILAMSTTVFNVYLSEPIVKVYVDFLQPIQIRCNRNHLIISFMKMEPNVKTFFPEQRDARKIDENNKEEDVLAELLQYFYNEGYNLKPTDINKGIKALWEADTLDCHQIDYLDDFSTGRQTMNEDLTFKKKYPDRYKDVILRPLGRSIWKYLLQDQYFCKGFTADPNIGRINITGFPTNKDQVKNVINKILIGNQ